MDHHDTEKAEKREHFHRRWFKDLTCTKNSRMLNFEFGKNVTYLNEMPSTMPCRPRENWSHSLNPSKNSKLISITYNGNC